MTNRWPFWAPTPDESIEHALDLAGIKEGEHLLDLGCGDGRVLEAAVRRGATATGYEADPLRAAMARERLEPLEDAVKVEVADFHTVPLEKANVVFAFLSPATLFRLRHRLAELPPETRIVTYGYGFVGWEMDELSESCFLYTLPPKPSASSFREGWSSAGLVVGGPPRRTVLAAFSFGARAGDLNVDVDASLENVAEVYLGEDACEADLLIPIDIKVTTGEEGVTQSGVINVQGHDLLVAVIVAGEEMRRREVKREHVDALREALREVEAGLREPETLLQEPTQDSGTN